MDIQNIKTTQNLIKKGGGTGRVVKGATTESIEAQIWYWYKNKVFNWDMLFSY